ncbi:MAG: hypothetical protein ACWA6X_02305 [Bauldia sp.]
MRRTMFAALAAAGLVAGCTPAPGPSNAAAVIVFDCDGFQLRIARTDGAIMVETAGDGRTLRQSRDNALRYEARGAVAVFAPNRTFVEWTAGGVTSACIADV